MIEKSILLVYLTLLPLVLSVYSVETFEQPKQWLTIVTAALLLPFLRRPKKVSIIDVAVMAVLGSAVLSTFTARSLVTALYGDPKAPMGLISVAALAFVYVAIRQNFRSLEDRRSLLFVLVVGSLPVCLYAILQACGLDPVNWQGNLVEYGMLRPGATLGHPNDLGGYLVVLLPFELYFTFQNAAMSLVLGPMLATILITQSRGCWIAAIVSILVLICGAWRPKRRLGAAVVFLSWVAVTGLCAWAACHISPQFSESFSERARHLFSLGPAREFYWRAAWEIFKAHPFVGVGTDGFRTAFEHVRTPAYWNYEWAGSIGKAHNDVLNTLATQGIVGGAAFLFLVMALMRSARKISRRYSAAGDYYDRAFLLAVVASIAGYYTQNISSFPSTTTGALFMAVIAMVNLPKDEVGLSWVRPAGLAAAVLASVMLIYNFALIPMKASSCAAAAASVASKHPGTAIRMLDFASDLQPRDPLYPALIGDIAETVGEWPLAAKAWGLASYLEPEEAIFKFRHGLASGDFKFIALAQLIEPANPVFGSVLKPKQ